MAVPRSATETETWTPSRTADTVMGDPSGEWEDALESRLPSTWTMRRRSAMIIGRSAAISTSRAFPVPPVTNLLLASSASGCSSDGSWSTGSVPPSRYGPRPARSPMR